MASFFDARIEDYDDHMQESVEQFDVFYEEVSCSVPLNAKQVLILGSGTGTDLSLLLKRLPDCQFTCVDMSIEMLNALKEKFKSEMHRIELIQGSYFDVKYTQQFDAIVAVMTMHHWIYEDKLQLYKKIKMDLTIEGCYVEGDYYATLDDEKEFIERRTSLLKEVDQEVFYHIDIPFHHSTQERLIKEAGFKSFDRVYVFKGKEVQRCY